MPLQQFDERVIASWINEFDSATPANTNSTIFLNQTGDCRIDTFVISSNDTVDNEVLIGWKPFATPQIVGSVKVAAGAGYNGVPIVDVLAAIFPATQAFLLIPSGTTITASWPNLISAGKRMTVTIQAGQF